jgi:N-alpha-acetyltransferase 15/16, NatA auxiliary subunit
LPLFSSSQIQGLKAADQILRKHADHGDTQAMKALILNSTGQKDEAFALAKLALRSDMKSHVCWHVYGLLYKDAKNFEESLKAYRYALRIEPESPQIQRDLAHLQIQIRDYAGYVQSRRAMLKARPTLRSNWTALAIAQHLAGDLDDAEKTLSAYEESLKSIPPKTDTEHQQAILYKNMIIAESGDYTRALEHLDAATKNVYDKQLVMELRAEYLLKLERNAEAEKAYRVLLDRNHENRAYYGGLQSALALSTSDSLKLRELYEDLVKKYPNADAPRRIPLDFLVGEDFRQAVDSYLQKMLRKGVPSTFANIKSLYQDSFKQTVIEELVEKWAQEIPTANGSTESSEETARFENAVLYFLAQHYNYPKSRDLKKAMETIEKLIAKEPKSVDFHMTKARIFKNYGDSQKAAETMDYARSLDERDRHINTKAAKYFLRNNDHEKAVETMGKFTRQDAPGGPLGDLNEMQCVWFITEDGESYLRQRRLGLALKRFTSIYNIFDLWQEDQFDFHSFSLRKGQIRAYVEMLRWEDHLRDHPFYTRAAVAACKAYILLHDRPELAKGDISNGVGHLDANEKKKAAKKAKKAQEAEPKKDPKNEKKDPDPEGKTLLETTDPLKDALKFLIPALESSPKSLEVQEVGFEVFIRRSK